MGRQGRRNTKPDGWEEEQARRTLSSSPKKTASKFQRWIEDPANASALQFVELWLDMAAKGETDWTLSRVLRELVDSYGLNMATSATDRFAKILREKYGERYTRAESKVKHH